MVPTIPREALLARLVANPQLVILEALGERYYNDAHLPGARLFPHDQVDALAPAVVPDKSSEIVVYCSNTQCRNSHVAAHRLAALGYTNVSVYAGGKADWVDAGLPVQRGARAA